MVDLPKPPHLTLVDPDQNSDLDQEFAPLPFYGWDQRPAHLPISQDEAATAIYLAHGELLQASRLLKVPLHKLTRLVHRTPALQRVLDESFEQSLIRARAVPIDTLFDPDADARRKEWASTKILSSRFAQGDPFSPAPAAAALTVNQDARSFTVVWGDGTKIAELGPPREGE